MVGVTGGVSKGGVVGAAAFVRAAAELLRDHWGVYKNDFLELEFEPLFPGAPKLTGEEVINKGPALKAIQAKINMTNLDKRMPVSVCVIVNVFKETSASPFTFIL
ncbi:hypothetical protein YC2023_011953 [Brassica napus]